MYAIQANIVFHEDNGSTVRQLPTFYLAENVQGIRSEHDAYVIAYDLLNSMYLNRADAPTLHVSVVKV